MRSLKNVIYAPLMPLGTQEKMVEDKFVGH